MSATFLPDRLRPRVARRRPRRRLLPLVILPAILAVLPWWRVRAVQLDGCSGLPDSVTASMRDLVGRSALEVSPGWVRRQLEVWPAVASVEVQLDLPGTLRVSTTPATARASVGIGGGWHAVTGEGVLAGVLMRPVEPVLVGFPRRAIELRKGLAIAGRVADASGMRVEEVRIITPADYQLRLRRPADQRSVVVHVAPEVTFGESYWCDRVSAGDQPPPWADLRWDDRVVVGGLG